MGHGSICKGKSECSSFATACTTTDVSVPTSGIKVLKFTPVESFAAGTTYFLSIGDSALQLEADKATSIATSVVTAGLSDGVTLTSDPVLYQWTE